MAKAQTVIIEDFAQRAVREAGETAAKLDAARAMLAALESVNNAANRETIVAGRHKRTEGQGIIAAVVAAIAAAKAAGL